LRILLAEDNRVNQKLAVGLLEKWGHEVTVVENGQAAVQFWEAHSFDLIILDIQMPIMDGLEAAKIIREQECQRDEHVPIIAMTAHAMQGDREQCLSAGMDGYIAKPLRIDELYRIIESLSNDRAGEIISSAACDVESPSTARAGKQTHCELDWAHALKNCGGDEDLLRDVLLALQDEAPKLMEQLVAASNQRDAKTAHRMAHSIKGALRLFGITTAMEVAARIEFNAARENFIGVEAILPELRSQLEPITAQINERLQAP
jgi:CheY-like chemotaxis protein